MQNQFIIEIYLLPFILLLIQPFIIFAAVFAVSHILRHANRTGCPNGRNPTPKTQQI